MFPLLSRARRFFLFGMCGRKSLAGEGEGSGVSGPYSAGIYSICTCSCHMTLPKVFNIYQDSTSIKKAMV